MGAELIVVDTPFLDDVASVAIVAEQMFIETLIPQASVERLNKAVLHWLSWSDLVPFNATILLPGKYRVRGEFCSIVADHH